MNSILKKLSTATFVLLMTVTTSIVMAADEAHDEIKAEYMFDFIIDTTAPQMIGQRMVVPITGGRFEGPALTGTVLNVGADWIRTRADGVSELDVRVTLKTDDDALIYMSYTGVLNRAENYWRVVPKFETSAEKYAYLTKIIAVGVGKRIEGKTAYSIYKIL